MSRLLLLSLQQATRSIVLTLLPLSFLALLVWATAGSANGNTADPLRAALWVFLASHQVPLHLSLSNATLAGSLTYLPIGALVIPFFASRAGFTRMIGILGDLDSRSKRLALLDFSIAYALLGYLFSLVALGGAVNAPFYSTIPIIFLVAFVSAFTVSDLLPTRPRNFAWIYGLRFAVIALIFLIGLGSIVLSTSLIWHFATVKSLTDVIAPGVIGGLTLLSGQVLYLPNIAVASLSYLAGAGIQIGNGTLISPLTHRVDEIPAIPLLGALPVRTHLWTLTLSLLIVALGFAMVRFATRRFIDETERKRFYLSALISLFALSLILARMTSGELLSTNLSSVGPQWWLMPIVITVEIAAGSVLTIYLPRGIKAIKERDRV